MKNTLLTHPILDLYQIPKSSSRVCYRHETQDHVFLFKLSNIINLI